MKDTFNKTILLIVVIFVVIWVLFFMSFYGIRKLAIDEFSKQQMIIAEQVASAISDYLQQLEREIEFISVIDDVYYFNNKGESIIRDYYMRRDDLIKSVTYVDEKGIIRWSVPYNRSIVGIDISSQPHVKYLLNEHRPVLSDVFKSVQGYRAVAMHIPVIKNGRFHGSIGVLIDFEYLSGRFLEKIGVGDGGYAWMLNANGTILYSPVQGYAGKTINEVFGGFHQLVEICESMMRGEKGSGSYDYNFFRGNSEGLHKNYASYTPLDLMNTRWSIAVSTPEKQILAIMNSLRNKLVLTAVLLLVVNIAFIFITLKSWKLAEDIINKKRSEAFLAENESVLETALNSAGKIASGISHDLNNVLAGILNSTEVLEMRHKGDARTEKYTGFIKDAAMRGSALVQKLNNLSLLGSGGKSFIDVHQIVDEARNYIVERSGGRLKLKLQLDAADTMIQASPLNLRKIIIRLSGRIAAVIPDCRGLTLSTENIFTKELPERGSGSASAGSEYLKLSVRNIPARSASKYITGLFQFLTADSAPGGKTDPGIHDIYNKVSEIGGTMSIDTSDSESPVISVFLPVCKVDEGRFALTGIEHAKDGGTILIVEDESAIRNALERILADLGYTVYTAEDGLAGVELFRQEYKKIDLVILDIVMPVKSGMEALKEMIEIDSNAVIYMTSGYVTVSNLDDLISMGAAGFINKPVTIPDLSRIVSGAIEGRSKKEERDTDAGRASKA